MLRSPSPPERCTRLVGETEPGRRRSGYLTAPYDVNEGSVRIGGVDVRDLTGRLVATLVGLLPSPRRRTCST